MKKIDLFNDQHWQYKFDTTDLCYGIVTILAAENSTIDYVLVHEKPLLFVSLIDTKLHCELGSI